MEPNPVFGSNAAKIIDQIKPKPDFAFNPRMEQIPVLNRAMGGLNLTVNPKATEK